MALRTANSKLAGQITMNNCDMMGVDLVEVNAHWGARPEHAVWQGKVYSRSGKHPKYKSIAETRYGHADGLCGINCGHQFYPFFEGISTPNEWEPEPEPQYYKGKEYTYAEATQKQRQMERDIRATKREIEACKVLGSDTTALNSKKNRQIEEYHAFSKSMGILPKDNRLRVGKGSTNVTKTKAYKDYSEKSKDKGYIRIPKVPASTVSEKIKNGEYSTKLSKQQYEKHVKGTKKYEEYRITREKKGGNPQSILTISAEDAQKVIDSKAGTGIIKVDRNGNPKPQEQITCDNVVGQYYYKGKYINTNKAVIHYSKRSAHLVPIRGDDYD